MKQSERSGGVSAKANLCKWIIHFQSVNMLFRGDRDRFGVKEMEEVGMEVTGMEEKRLGGERTSAVTRRSIIKVRSIGNGKMS